MPRRAQIPRKAKYAPTLTRTTDRFVVKLMKDGKKGLAERILRQALARAEASAHRPGLEVLEPRSATPRRSSRSSRAASVARRTRCRWRSAATAGLARCALARPVGPQAQRQVHEREVGLRVRGCDERIGLRGDRGPS